MKNYMNRSPIVLLFLLAFSMLGCIDMEKTSPLHSVSHGLALLRQAERFLGRRM